MKEKHQIDQKWHEAINKFEGAYETQTKFMYNGKMVANESTRLPLLFKMEREENLPKIHKQCSLSKPEKIIDNHLTCCLGIECRKCPMLIALEKAELKPEQIDNAKGWTCIAHILMKGGDNKGEGFILTTDDRMYWDNVYKSLSGENQ